jgi:BirA family biotin operon repressor/biotin-[acetyl-CoA-carboxylase] ligase
MTQLRPAIQWELQRLSETDSTNRLAAEQILERWNAGGSASGIAFLAGRQTGGRGQHGRRWESPPGGLYLSAVLEDMPAELRGRMALVAGVAVAQVIAGALPLQIRWPNDLVTPAGRKIAGILCEAVALGDRWAVIVGIGVNVHTRMDELSANLRPAATSLAAEGATLAIDDLARAILAHLDASAQTPLSEIVAQVRARDWLLGRKIEVVDGALALQGTAAGIADSGALLLQCAETIRTLERGCVRNLQPAEGLSPAGTPDQGGMRAIAFGCSADVSSAAGDGDVPEQCS